MVYRRRAFGRKKTYFKRRRYTRRPTYTRRRRVVVRRPRATRLGWGTPIEKKYWTKTTAGAAGDDNQLSPQVPTTFGNIDVTIPRGALCLNDMKIGTGFNRRIGNKIKMKHLEINMKIARAATQTYTALYYRIFIFIDKQHNKADLTTADIITGGAYDPKNLNNRARFITIYDKKHFINSTDKQELRLEKFFNLQKYGQVQYTGDTDTTHDGKDIATNALFLMFWPLEATVGTAGVSDDVLSLNYRLCYTDN